MIAFRTIRGLVNRHHRRFTAIPPSAKPLSQFPATESVSSASKRSPLRRFLKFASLGTLASVGAIGCVTYAYSVDELYEKTKGFTRQYYRTQEVGVQEGKESSISDVVFLPILHVAANSVKIYLGVRYLIEEIVKENRQCTSDKLLPDAKRDVFTLVLDLNDTLVHSDWKPALDGEGDGQPFKRPGMEAFLKHAYDLGYELVLYTDEFNLGVNHLFVSIERGGYFSAKLSKGSNIKQDGKNYRDLSRLNRDPSRILYVSAHALENCLQPENCVPIKPWNKDMEDTTLMDLLHFLDYVAYKGPDDIRLVLSPFNSEGKDVATEFKYHQRRILEAEETRKLDEQMMKERMKERMMQKWRAVEERRKMDEWQAMVERRKMEEMWTLS